LETCLQKRSEQMFRQPYARTLTLHTWIPKENGKNTSQAL